MRIGFDARCLEEENISGVGEYALELIRNLLEGDKENHYLIFSNAHKKLGQNLAFFRDCPNAELKRFRFPNKIFNFFLWYFNWPKIDRLLGGVDVFFAPNINFLAVSRKTKFVVTFHDLSFERYPEFFLPKTRLWHYYFVNPKRIAEKSERIIAVSESTKKDLEEIYGINAKKICPIHHGIGENFKVINRNDPKLIEVQKKYNLPYKFILFLGNIEPRKNISSIVEAYKQLIKSNPFLKKYRLILAGNISPLCRGIIKKEKIDTIGYIKREDKPFVYNLAALFVYPSHFEGFGLPILEAMACGTPVICSHNSSLPEVAGDAAITFNPCRPQEIFESMRMVLNDEKLYADLREKGLTQTKKFSWSKCAKETISLLNTLSR